MALRVAVLSAAPVPAHGWGRYTRDLIQALAGQGVEITLLTTHEVPPDPALPVAHWRALLPSLTPARRFSALRMLAAWPAVRRALRGCAVAHVIAEPYALLLAGSTLPAVVTAHGTYVPHTARRAILGALYRPIYRRAHLVAVSSFTGEQVRAVLPDTRLTVIPNGVHAVRFQRQPAHRPIKRGPTVLAVGQVKARKGYHVLIAAMRHVRARVPDAQALIVGASDVDPAYTASLHALIAEHDLEGAVRITGRIPDDVLMGWYHTADVFALPSLNIDGRFEGFGLAYLEASAAGLPVIGTRGCGAEDAIIEGETGFLVPQDDPGALAASISTLLHDAALRQRLGEAGAVYAATQTWERVAARMVTIYENARKDARPA